MDLVIDAKKDGSEVSISMSPETDHILESIDEEKTNNVSVPNLIGNDNQHNETDLQVMKCERSKSLDPTQHLHGFNPVRKRFDSLMSLGDVVGDAILCESNERTKDGKWCIFIQSKVHSKFTIIILFAGKK